VVIFGLQEGVKEELCTRVKDVMRYHSKMRYHSVSLFTSLQTDLWRSVQQGKKLEEKIAKEPALYHFIQNGKLNCTEKRTLIE
jgi:hypothetical protein